MTTKATHSNLDDTLLALADPTRRLAKPFEMSLNAVSKHIRAPPPPEKQEKGRTR